jgi:8-oxo-dGTP pyrophosphatase MutT (NUDIX family)
MRLPLPAAMLRRAREFSGPPAPARAAATVVLLRPAEPTFEAYVLKRATTMAFGGVYAFPGGGVDTSDRPETVRTDWPARLGVPEPEAKAVVGAAARELFEEAGVLLAGPATAAPFGNGGPVGEAGPFGHAGPVGDGGLVEDGGPVGDGGLVGDVSGPGWEADRAAVLARELTMTELLTRRGLRLRDDLLFPWSRWITPEFEPRRYDTWFFVAALPESQLARDVSGESDGTDWISPAATDGLAMLPPTVSTLNDLRAYSRISEVLEASAQRNAADPVMPRIELTDDGAVLHLP